MLISLFEATPEFKKSQQSLETANNIEYFSGFSIQARTYILDLCTLAIWENKTLDPLDCTYLKILATSLQLDKNMVHESI